MRYSFGLGESSLDHRRREEFPAIFSMLSFERQNRKNIVYYRQLILSVVWSY